MDKELNFEDIPYGAFILCSEYGSFNENVRYTSVEFNKLYARKMRLPSGRNNIIYILSNSFQDSINILNNKTFIIPSTYRRIFYPKYVVGSFCSKRFRLPTIDRKQRDEDINNLTKFKSIQSRRLTKSQENIIYLTCDIYNSLKPIMEKLSIKRCYENFFQSFSDILNKNTPEMIQQEDESNNRLIVIDVDSFRFSTSSMLKDVKANPLYLIYLAFLRNKDLANLNIDIDMMICSKNLFLKFNPSKVTKTDWQVFRRALFRMMSKNLDDFTEQLPEEDKAQIDSSIKDKMVSSFIKDALDPYTKNISPSTKVVLEDEVESRVRSQAALIAAKSKEIRIAQDEIDHKIHGKEKGSFSHKDDITYSDDNGIVDMRQVNYANINKLDAIKPKKILNTNSPVRLSKDKEDILRSMGSYQSLYSDDEEDDEGIIIDDAEEEDIEEIKDEIQDDVEEILATDEDIAEKILDEIQNENVPINKQNKSPINSERDKKLREEQKKVVVQNETIETILQRDANNVKIKEDDKSKVMHTSNKNMQTIKFGNFDKTYLEELYMKDMVSVFDSLKDQESPFYISNIDIKDNSDSLNYQDRWTVTLIDELNKKHTLRVDIPKFKDNKFMLIGGSKYIILKQNFYNPLVKDQPNSIIITTNYNKVTLERVATKSLSVIERIFSLMKKTGNDKMFMSGDSSKSNKKYVSSLEYDELARNLFRFSSKNCTIWFSRDYIKENIKDKIPNNIKANEFFIGIEGDSPIIINEDSGLDRGGRTIAEIIEMNLPEDYKTLFNSIKGPKQSMFVQGELAGKPVPIGVVLIIWVGLREALMRMKIRWKFNSDIKRLPKENSSTKYIRFSNGILEYEKQTFAELILNGLSKLKTEQFKFEDLDEETSYAPFIYSIFGNYNGINEIKMFYNFLMDPITKSVCQDLSLPDDPVDLLIHAVKLLADNSFVNKACDTSYRVRSIEIIPSILYSCIAAEYKNYIKNGRNKPLSLNERCVIKTLLSLKTVSEYSTLNPVIEIEKTNIISTKGYRGSNSEWSYDEQKRSYDSSSIGKLAMSTPIDANVGIVKNLSIEPTIKNARGYRDQSVELEDLKDVNIFSGVELLTPGTARVDDPTRTAIGGKQSGHTVPVADASPSLVSNGYDEAVQFHLSDDFVINAEEDGEVVDVDESSGFIMVKYKSGKVKAISTNPEVVKNSGGGFYISNQMTAVYTKIGQKFKKDEPLAYHNKFFRYSKMNGLRYAIGPLAKIAIITTYNTYEDAGICTQSLANKMRSAITFIEKGKFKKNTNITSMVKIGDHVNIGDVLIKFDTSVGDDEIAKFLSKLSEESSHALEDESKTDVKANHAGKVIDIKVYTLLDPSNLSPSLAKIVKDYFKQIDDKKKFLEKYDSTDGTYKAGYLMTDSAEPIKDKYNRIKGEKGIDVLIEIYIEHEDVMKVGDKLALFGPNKQVVSEVIPEGYEPYSEFRPDEEISVFCSPGTVARRMVPGTLSIAAAFKCMIELKRKIQENIKFK